MKQRLASTISSVLFILTPFRALALTPLTGVVRLDPTQGKTEFLAIGKPSFLKIHGTAPGPQGEFRIVAGRVTGSATFLLAALDTGIALRNEHMKKKYLETDRFPEAKLVLTECTLPTPTAEKMQNVPFKANLTLHGVQKPVEGVATISRTADRLEVATKFRLHIADFSIEKPGYSGVTMADEVTVDVGLASAVSPTAAVVSP